MYVNYPLYIEHGLLLYEGSDKSITQKEYIIMELSSCLRPLAKSAGFENAIIAYAEAGFRKFDFNPWSQEELDILGRLSEKYGLSVHQTHGPDNRYTDKTEEQLLKDALHCVRLSKELGAKYVVFHGNVFDYDNMEYSNEAALQHNYEFFTPIVEEAEKVDIKIAFENTFADYLECAKGRPHFCKRAEDLLALIDKFGSSHVCACWDTGHAAIALGHGQIKGIELLGKRIECTHLHDNNFKQDLHLMPLLAEINWDEVMHAFAAFCNVQALSFEPVYEKIPAIAAKEYAALKYKIGLDLISRMK